MRNLKNSSFWKLQYFFFFFVYIWEKCLIEEICLSISLDFGLSVHSYHVKTIRKEYGDLV